MRCYRRVASAITKSKSLPMFAHKAKPVQALNESQTPYVRMYCHGLTFVFMFKRLLL
jgi:hypothetical protein